MNEIKAVELDGSFGTKIDTIARYVERCTVPRNFRLTC